MSRPLKFPLLFFLTGLTAVHALAAVDMFLKFDTVPGESGGHQLRSFQWGVGRGVSKGPACLNTNSIHVSWLGRLTPMVKSSCDQHATIPSLTLDIGGEHHVLQNVTFAQCQAQQSGDGGVVESISLNYTKCATHYSAYGSTLWKDWVQKTPADSKPNAIIGVAAAPGAVPPPPSAMSLVSLKFLANEHATLVRKAGGTQDALVQAFQTKHVIPTLTLTLNNGQKWTFTNVTISGFNGDGRGTETLSLNFTNVQGLLSGFQDGTSRSNP